MRIREAHRPRTRELCRPHYQDPPAWLPPLGRVESARGHECEVCDRPSIRLARVGPPGPVWAAYRPWAGYAAGRPIAYGTTAAGCWRAATRELGERPRLHRDGDHHEALTALEAAGVTP